MTATSLLQTWLNPTPPDPVQAKMMWIMPLVFSVMFFFFPAGLVLYWLTNNILSIAQQYLINKKLGVLKQVAGGARRENPPMPALSRQHDPIVAIATASGRGAIGIVRVSGHRLDALILALCGRHLEPRHATLLAFVDAAGAAIDRGLAIHFPAPHSYTGEDVLELQAHGGPVVLQLLLARCLEAAAELDPATQQARLAHLRVAAPGEFTERAFLNDKLDLAQAEAVADLIDASTEAAARSAARSLGGAFSAQVDALAAQLVELRLLVEATLDFPDEELEFLERAGARQRLAAAAAQLDSGAGRGAPGRPAARRHPGRARRPAERGQELLAQCPRRRRAGDRHADPRHDARQGRRDDPDRRRADPRRRHRRAARSRRRGRAHRHRPVLVGDRALPT